MVISKTAIPEYGEIGEGESVAQENIPEGV